ncbi:ubiquitin-like protein 3-like [Moniliophthora roreri]|uniref:Ubiquitin-like domain-containing protein n=1 Tax=Moniliophthora roreri TaxID=221103 RepID=A0A0W0G2X6_MONRR|nr:ubiquitin-like protein 3-like [Moniliophthora roreri]
MDADRSHILDFSHHITSSTRRPATSPGLRSTGNNITFFFDSPPIPGDSDYTGDDLVPSTSTETGQRQVTRDREAPSLSRTPSEARLYAPSHNFHPGGYSVSTSARTSYTRVDLTEMENETTTPNRAGDDGISGNVVGEEQRQQDRSGQRGQEQQGGHNTDEQAQNTSPTPIPQTPQVSLCFLLISGKRRVMSFDPETTVGRVKELVWNAWPSDWQDEQPPTPWHLRILHLGKILQDDDTLKG